MKGFTKWFMLIATVGITILIHILLFKAVVNAHAQGIMDLECISVTAIGYIFMLAFMAIAFNCVVFEFKHSDERP